MGIDIDHRFDRKVRRTEPKSTNVYLGLLVDLYRYLARRTESKFNETVLKRLYMSKTNRPPLSLSKLQRHMKAREDKIAVVVATVVDDEKIYEFPKMTIAAQRFTKSAKARIIKNGGEALTLDQLAMRDPLGANSVLLQGSRKARKSYKHFGKPAAVDPTKRGKARTISSSRK